jgi:23S rRNA pseudouridine2605 synthase
VVRINGEVAPLGARVDPARDKVTVRGEPVKTPTGSRYLALHKPVGYLVTARDPGHRPTVFDLLPEEERTRHLVPVGRLDLDSSGLLLLTDDGNLAHRLTHPRYKVPKQYVVTVQGHVRERDLRQLRRGVMLDDGPTQPAEVERLDSMAGVSRLKVVITEGRKRQVRRMLQQVGHPVTSLSRVAMGPVHLGRLRPGSYRRLRPGELDSLRQTAGLGTENEDEDA